MQRVQGYARILSSGAPAPGSTITVYETGTTNIATIYSDDLSTPTAKANPFAADGNGYWAFYAAGSKRYDVQVSGTGITTPYTLFADLPSGLGDGTIPSYTFATLPATSAPHAGRLARVSDQQLGVWIDDGTAWVPLLEYAGRSFAVAGLPAAGTAGRIRRVTDGAQGLYIDDGAAWTPALAYGFPTSTKAGLPTPALQGRIRQVTDSQRGLWADAGTGKKWFGVAGEIANVVEFGALRAGGDDTTAIQAAINSFVGSSGIVLFPPGTYFISVPLTVPAGVMLMGYGATLSTTGPSWAGDCMIRGSRRDDNIPADEDVIGVAGLTLKLASSIAQTGVTGIDLTGCSNSVVRDVTLVGKDQNVSTSAAYTAIRLADKNPTSTSTKRCQGNLIENVWMRSWDCFIEVVASAQSCDSNTIVNLFTGGLATSITSTGAFVGFDFTGVTSVVAGTPLLTVIGGRITSDTSLSAQPILGNFPNGVVFIGVNFSSWQTVSSIPGDTMLGGKLGAGVSGTSATNAIAAGGNTSGNFEVGAYLKLAAGTALAAGVNTYTWTLTGASLGATFIVAPVSGLPVTPCSFQAVLSSTTLTVTVVAAAGVTLPSDFVFRVLQVGP